jgi:sarcosine oxidase
MREGRDRVYDVLVVGGGIGGLSALYHLGRLGLRRVGLAERFRLGHDRGSSHGQSRITRGAYVHPDYVRLMRVARGQEWPRLERDAGVRLIHQTPGCFWGPPGGNYESYARAVERTGVDVERIDVTVARRRFPQFRFEGVESVLHDRTAGLVAAADAMAALVRICRGYAGVDIREEVRVIGLDPSRDPIRIETDGGRLETERLILAAGPWMPDLLPFLKPHLKVARQTACYFRMAGPPERFMPGRFPVWCYLGEEPNGVVYGLPEFGREGIKVARHVTSGVDDDPDRAPDGPDSAAIEWVRAFLGTRFADPVERFVASETCLYTMAGSEDFILGLHPENPRVAIGSACSGHGFKFGPLTGRLLAELALHGRTEVPEFEAIRGRFEMVLA